MEIEFFVPLRRIPTATHQEKKTAVVNNRAIHYEPDNVKAARSIYMDYFGRYAPDKPLTGPLALVTKWCYPITGKHRDGEWKMTRPDTDNIIKLPKDCMTRLGFWKDDAQITQEITEKFWAELPGIYVNVKELEEIT